MLTFEQIKELIELVARHELAGVELERSGFSLRVTGRCEVVAPVAAPVPLAPAEAVASAPSPPATSRASAEEPSGPPEGTHVVHSPIVGTFYSAPSPDAEPYVRVGDQVRKGQVVCIVEAMKLMNEIESDMSGEILEVYPKNAQPVEYGEPLFAIRSA